MDVLTEESLVYKLLENPIIDRDNILKIFQKAFKENHCGIQSLDTIKRKYKEKMFSKRELFVMKNYFVYEIKDILDDLEFYD